MCFSDSGFRDGDRHRGIFPIPFPHNGDIVGVDQVNDSFRSDALVFCQGVVVILNYGYGCPTRRNDMSNKCNAAQRAALRDFGRLAILLAEHLAKETPADLCESTAWDHFQSRSSEPGLALVASLVDCLPRAGRCDPMKLIPERVAEVVASPDHMFGAAPPGLEKFSGFFAGFSRNT